MNIHVISHIERPKFLAPFGFEPANVSADVKAYRSYIKVPRRNLGKSFEVLTHLVGNFLFKTLNLPEVISSILRLAFSSVISFSV